MSNDGPNGVVLKREISPEEIEERVWSLSNGDLVRTLDKIQQRGQDKDNKVDPWAVAILTELNWREISVVCHKGKSYPVDCNGFLQDPEMWDAGFVDYIKEQEGLSEITDDHWKVLHYLRDYYEKNGIAPMVRILTKVTGFKLKQLFELFPGGPAKGACKMAGLQKPTGCI